MDPLAEKFPGRSPYEYSFNNPVRLIDPTGMAPEDSGPNPDSFWHRVTWSSTRRDAQRYANAMNGYETTVYKNDSNTWTARGTMTTQDESKTYGFSASFSNGEMVHSKSWSFGTGQVKYEGPVPDAPAGGATISSPSDSYFSHPNTHLAMGVLQAGEIALTDLALAKAIGYGFKGYYALKQTSLTAESFSIHPRLNSQLDIGHRATTFVADEVLQTGKVGVKDFNSVFFDKHSVFFNKNIGGKDFSVGINPYNKTIFHQAPGVFK